MATALRDLDAADSAAREVGDYLVANERKSLLRFITCGSVDDGKSTLIGRLLYDSRMLFEDQLAALERDSRRPGKRDGPLDFASLVDGLAAEREQGITIDVAYRFFATARRKFIVADTPGHEQYTRNMVTGASTAELAVILVDARAGLLTQTRRHSHIVHLLGIRNIVLAVNKMDLVGFEQTRFEEIAADYRDFASEAGIDSFVAIPLSGLGGDNVTTRSVRMEWHSGPTLLEHLEQVPVGRTGDDGASFRMPVQWVSRPGQDFRGYAGTIASGRIGVGDRIRILPSGGRSAVERIVTFNGDLPQAVAGQAVTLTLGDKIDCSRGDMILGEEARAQSGDRLHATLVWMAGEPMVPGRAYSLKIGTQTVAASVARVHEVRDIDAMGGGARRSPVLNDIVRCEILLDRPILALAYRENRRLGGFILIDRASHATLAAGMVEEVISAPPAEGGGEGGSGRIIWLTGSSSRERADFARKAHERLSARGRSSFVLDDSILRDGLSSDLGTSQAEEVENRRRAAEVARLLSRAGVTVLAALDPPPGEARPGTQVDIASVAFEGDWVI
jgi:bifunctional enzyme CysN/CysC